MAVKFRKGVDSVNNRLINVADPSSATDATTKQYVDNRIDGLSYKDEVRVATTTNGTLATAYANGQTIDGQALATNDRILLKDQTTQTENGIYKVNAAGAPTRATDADSTAELNNATVYVLDGTVNVGREYTQTTKNPTVGSSNIVFTQKQTGITYSADGNGIEMAATVFSLELDGTSLQKSATGVRLGSAAAASGLVADGTGLLSVGAGTGITVNADDVQVNTAVVSRIYQADCVVTTNPQAFTHGLGKRPLVMIVTPANDEVVMADLVVTTTTITVDWGAAPTAAEYRVIAVG